MELVEVIWYDQLVQELRKLAFAGIVVTYWHIGQRIKQDEDKFGKAEYGSKRIENLAKDLGMTARDLWWCLQFAKKCVSDTQLEEISDKSWRWITHFYLPEPRAIAVPQLELPSGKYAVIYADPPWSYFEGGYKNQSQHYGTMDFEGICQLPVGELAAEDCVLFMWVTYPMLDQFMDVLRCWGFEYSTVGFTWVKSNKSGEGFFFGLGSWTRANAEICVIATRGSVARQDASVSQIIYSPIEAHSSKPAIVRDKIVQLVGDVPRIELFARQATSGWDVWGNEA